MLLWIMYLVGYLISMMLVISNSLKSNTNGLNYSWGGFMKWLKISFPQTIFQLFIVIIIFPAAIKTPLTTIGGLLQASGFPLPPWSLAGFVGTTSTTLAYQVTGLIPGLRKEVASVAPPPPDQAKS